MRLPDLLDIEMLRRLAEANYRANGMPIGIIDAVDDSVLVGFGWQDICTMYHRVNAITAARCRESDDYINRNLSDQTPCEYRCKNGLRDIGVPIRAGGEHLATLFLGQFFDAEEIPDRTYFVEQARQFGFDEVAYLAALDRVPVFSRAEVENILKYDIALAAFISDLADAALQKRTAQASLDRERALLASVMQATDVMLVYLDPDFNFVWVNEAYAATCGMTVAELVGRNHFVLYPHVENEAIFRRVRDSGVPVFYKDKPFEFPDQPERGVTYWDWSLVPVKDGSGTVLGLVFSLRETTKFKTAEMELRESETRFRALFENLLDGYAYCLMLYDEQRRPVDFVYLAVNAAFARLTGLENVAGRKVTEVIPGVRESEPGLFETYGRVASTGVPERFDIDFKPLGKWFAISVYSPKKDHFVAAFDDITSRKRIEQQLRDANRAKDEFIGMLSHELRNPLAPIRNSLYILDHAEPTGQIARRAKEVANRQLTHLTRLVDDLLDVTRIVRGKVELRRTDLDLAELTRRVCEDHRALMRDRGLRFSVEAPGAPVCVNGDETRLAQVIGNLLQNAAKFTPESGSVSVSVVTGRDTVEVRVHDTGGGIEPELLTDIFNPFVQAKQSLARTEGGLGLGLALVRGMVELHGGSVTASSEGQGRGALFTVRLPRVAAAIRGSAESRGGRAPGASSGLRVLVVDDNRDAAESLADVVRMLGHQSDVAFDGWTAVESVKKSPPNVVLCDLGLPGMSGYEVARTLRADERFDAVQLVAVSGYALPEDRQRALDAGFQEHIAKPADPAKVLRAIQSGPNVGFRC